MANPDLQLSFHFSNRLNNPADGIITFGAPGATPLQPNTIGINAWVFIVNVSGLSAASVTFQSAPSTGIPVTFAGTTVSGSNPTTTTTSSTYIATGYYPFIRALVGTMTGVGSIDITVFGWLSPTMVDTSLALMTAAQIVAAFSGTPTGSKFLRDDGVLAAPSAGSLVVAASPIVGGTVGRMLFEGAGNLLRESEDLTWSGTRLGIGDSGIIGANVGITGIGNDDVILTVSGVGTADNQGGYGYEFDFNTGGFAMGTIEAFKFNWYSGGSVVTLYDIKHSDLGVPTGTNKYYQWMDSRGVRRIREDSTFDSVGQAIEALYNPQFTKYTPGLANYERIVLGQWNGNVAEIGVEAGGTGTVRDLRLFGSNLLARFAGAAPADGDLVAGDYGIWLNPDNTTPSINFKAKKTNGGVVTAVVLLT